MSARLGHPRGCEAVKDRLQDRDCRRVNRVKHLPLIYRATFPLTTFQLWLRLSGLPETLITPHKLLLTISPVAWICTVLSASATAGRAVVP